MFRQEPWDRSSQIQAGRQEISSECFGTVGASLCPQTETVLLLIYLRSDGCWMSGLTKLSPASPCLWESPRALPCPKSRADPSSFQLLIPSCRMGLLKDDILWFLCTFKTPCQEQFLLHIITLGVVPPVTFFALLFSPLL